MEEAQVKKHLPGVTTITKLLNMPFLVKWANKLGKQGIDVTEYVENTARLGTLIHTIIESHIEKKEITLDEYTDEEIDLGGAIFYTHYMPWEQAHVVEPIFVEKQFDSILGYQGIIDFYCKLDGKYTIIDFKTSKSISNEHLLQVSAYKNLMEEHNYPVEQLLILDIKKDINSRLEEKYLTLDGSQSYWYIFQRLLDIYYMKKELKWE